MAVRFFAGILACTVVFGCGADPHGAVASATKKKSTTADPAPVAAATLAPAAVPDGYTRIVAPVVPDVAPGSDALYCQIVMAPFDHDMDVARVIGYQSKAGHHAAAYAIKTTEPVGTSRPCNRDDNTQIGGFLGGVGGEAGGGAKLPDGVVFRLAAGDSIMLNTHFLNTGTDAVDGQTVLDVMLEEPDPARTVAAMMVNINIGFSLAPMTETAADANCTLPRDLQVISFTNHMHNFGASAFTELLHADGSKEPVHADDSWSYDMQFNPNFTEWTVDSPLALKQGDVLHTHCDWDNTTASAIAFPDEMCVGIGFFITKNPTSPVCLNGSWMGE